MPFAAIRVSQGSETREVHSERLTAEEEKSMAREIRKAEQSARESIAGINSAENILMRRPDRAERTRAGAVDRLEEAVMAVIRGRLQKQRMACGSTCLLRLVINSLPKD